MESRLTQHSRAARVITVSDSRSAGQRPDTAGPAIRRILDEAGFVTGAPRLVPDERPAIESALLAACSEASLVLTTGGTGFSARDVTPEATLAVCERLAPGLCEAMRAASLAITPFAMLSRAQAGIRGKTLIVNLPGSEQGACDNLRAILPALPHALDVLLG